MGTIGYGIALLIGAVIGAMMMYFTFKEGNIIEGYEIRISALEAENARLRAEQELRIDDSEYHPENLERMTAKEIKYGGF